MRIAARRKWLWLLGALFLGAIIVCATVLRLHWPFTEKAVTDALEQASGRQVQIRTFHTSYFPPGCTAEGIRFLRHKHPELTPIITVERMVIRSSFTGMISSPTRLSLVRAIGTHMIVPAEREEGGNPTLLNSGPGGKTLAISKITADGAVLEFVRKDRREQPYVLKIDRLAVTNVGFGKPMSYAATLINTEPPGTIRAEGKFGPWNPNDVGATPVAGKYTYDNIQLGHFESLYGVGRASGEFSGPLAKIETSGRVDVSGFRVEGSNHQVALATAYQATVNGTTGDVQLAPAVAQFRHTRIEARGSIAGGNGDSGKTVKLTFTALEGRVDDLLYLFTEGPPGMSGNVKLNGQFVWPPGPRKFLEKIRMSIDCEIDGSRFTSDNTQGSIDRISESAQGEDKKELDHDGQTVLSQVRGNISVRDGVATLSNGKFQVPGAHARVHGTYNLLTHRVDLDGTLDTRGTLADATTGVKAVMLKVITPLFKKRGPERIVPFTIQGSYGNTTVNIDWKRRLAHLK